MAFSLCQDPPWSASGEGASELTVFGTVTADLSSMASFLGRSRSRAASGADGSQGRGEERS